MNVIPAWILLAGALLVSATSSPAAVGKGAQALLQNAGKLSLNTEQRAKITAIVRETVSQYNRLRQAESGQPDLTARLDALRRSSQQEALRLLTTQQKKIWDELANTKVPSPSQHDRLAARSLIIPTVEQLRNPPSPGAFGPSTGITQTAPHIRLEKRM